MGKWNLAVQVKGVAPMDPTSFGLPTGIYEVKITDSNQKQGSDPSKPPYISIEATVLTGEHAGQTALVSMGTDFAKAGNKRSWRALLESVGAPPAVLEQDAMTVGEETFQGKGAILFVQAKPEGDKEGYDQRSFITRAMADKIAAGKALAGGTTPAATTGAAQQPAAGGTARF
jgi:hypothetical protein